MHNIGLLICRLGGNAYQVMAGRGQLILIFLQHFLSSKNTKSKIQQKIAIKGRTMSLRGKINDPLMSFPCFPENIERVK